MPQHVSGVICIVGHLRSFGEASVYRKLRANVPREHVLGATEGMACPDFHAFQLFERSKQSQIE